MKSKSSLKATAALAVVFSALFGGCATPTPEREPTDAQVEESVLTINRLRHQLWGDKLYPENLP